MATQTTQQSVNYLTGLASLIASISALLFVWTIGLGETFQVLRDSTLVEPATLAVFGGAIGFLDKVMVFAIVATGIGAGGLGLYSTSKKSPEMLQKLESNLPMIIGLVAIVGFSTMAWELVQGNRTWGNFSDAQNFYNVFIAMGMVSAISQFFGNKAE